MNSIIIKFTVVLLGILTIACALQIFTRILGSSLTWTEELSRYCFIWINLLGSTILVKNGGHAVIDILFNNLKGKARLINELLINALTTFAAGVLLYQGSYLVFAVRSQSSMGIGIPMSLIYLAIPLCGFITCLHCLSNFMLSLSQHSVDDKKEKA